VLALLLPVKGRVKFKVFLVSFELSVIIVWLNEKFLPLTLILRWNGDIKLDILSLLRLYLMSCIDEIFLLSDLLLFLANNNVESSRLLHSLLIWFRHEKYVLRCVVYYRGISSSFSFYWKRDSCVNWSVLIFTLEFDLLLCTFQIISGIFSYQPL